MCLKVSKLRTLKPRKVLFFSESLTRRYSTIGNGLQKDIKTAQNSSAFYNWKPKILYERKHFAKDYLNVLLSAVSFSGLLLKQEAQPMYFILSPRSRYRAQII